MVHETCGLTREDQRNIKAAADRLPSGWRITLETTDDNETYARIVPPWNPNKSAFLIDREYHDVILTDNINKDEELAARVMRDVCDAVDRIAAIVSGAVFF